MAQNMVWWQTTMPSELIDIVSKTLSGHDNQFSTAETTGGVNLKIRDSKTIWMEEAHWITGLCWHYIMMANRENFLYDIDRVEGGTLQYTSYEPGEYYHWHVDADILSSRVPNLTNPDVEFVQSNIENIRKLSIIVQLSDPEEYSGGEVQLQYSDRSTGFIPKQKGTVIVFDSRTLHRVKKIKSGRRKSLVGWVTGPRWK